MASIARSTEPGADMNLILSSMSHLSDRETRVTIPRLKQRISLTQQWQIAEGEHLLDIGCGQGESTAVLAAIVGETGHVGGIDVILDYGSPYSIRESWAYLLDSPLGARISLECADTASHLKSIQSANDKPYDAAVMCHSLFYFNDVQSVFSLFQTLAEHEIRRIYVAEFSSEITFDSQEAHVLATRAQALYHFYKTPRALADNDLNVRAAPDRQAILKAASQAGFGLRREGVLTPESDVLEGRWESQYVTSEEFRKLVEIERLSPDREAEILKLIQRVKESMERFTELGVVKVRTMDVWWARFEVQTDS